MRAISAKSLAEAPYLEGKERMSATSVSKTCSRDEETERGLSLVEHEHLRHYALPEPTSRTSRAKDLLLHILAPRIRKELRIPRTLMLAPRLLHQRGPQPHGTRPIIPDTLDAAGLHGLKAHHHDHIDNAAPDERPGELQARGARRARVVRVVDGDVGHAELVEDTLAGGGVAVAVACHARLYVVVRDVCVQQGLCARFET